MVKIEDVKVIVYSKNERNNRLIKRFLSLKNKSFKPYSDEKNLAIIIDSLKEQGLKSKEAIILKEFKGRMFQKCPGSKNVICCNYLLLNTCFDCLYDCAYCFLNSYLNSFGIVQFTNVYSVVDEIKEFLENADAESIYRIGTGEFTDSLMMDETTGIAGHIINNIYPYKNVMIEFKTKSGNIDHLLSIKEKGNTVLAWSLNTKRNIKDYEKGASFLEERINAASKAADSGYFVAFHFDPIIIDKYIDEYPEVLDKLFKKISHEKIVWISLGCFRHRPGFKEVIKEKYPDELLTVEEMFPGPDGKFRYLKRKRVDIYKKMRSRIEFYSKKPYIYLCMESADVWRSVFNLKLNTSDDLEKEFTKHLRNNFF